MNNLLVKTIFFKANTYFTSHVHFSNIVRNNFVSMWTFLNVMNIIFKCNQHFFVAHNFCTQCGYILAAGADLVAWKQLQFAYVLFSHNCCGYIFFLLFFAHSVPIVGCLNCCSCTKADNWLHRLCANYSYVFLLSFFAF